MVSGRLRDAQLLQSDPKYPYKRPPATRDVSLSQSWWDMATKLFVQLVSCATGIATLLCLIAVLTIVNDINSFYSQSMSELKDFKRMADDAWDEMIQSTNHAMIKNFVQSSIAGRRKRSEEICNCVDSLQDCPAGSPGPIGPPGEPGLDGTPGAPGERGANGTQPFFKKALTSCITCPHGPPGPPGPDGPMGAPGQAGRSGPPGRAGRPGERGKDGEQGEPGQPGQPGFPGQKGYPGINSIKGKGARGPPGVPGPEGQRGNAGPNGEPGPKGNPGPPGVEGGPGRPGERGNEGPVGREGELGTPGSDASYCRCPPRSAVFVERRVRNFPPSSVPLLVGDSVDVGY